MKITSFSPLFVAMILLTQPAFGQNEAQLTNTSSKQTEMLTNQEASFDNLGKYINEHLQYPELAQKNGVEGKVIVEAVIGARGEIVSVGLVQGIGFGCDEELMELVSNMPKWKPAIKNGQYVSQKVSILTNFRLK